MAMMVVRRDAREKAAGYLARDLMSKPAVTVMPETAVVAAARLMDSMGIKRLPVVNLVGRLIGIVSRCDLLKVFLRTDVAITDDVRRELERVPGVDASVLTHLGNLRTAMVAWIIGGHALPGYTKIGGWQYAEVHEVAFAPSAELVLLAILGPTALFVIGTFFFLSGLVGEDAMARKGPARFAIDRLLRLGLPFVVFVALVWPLFMWFAYLAGGRRRTRPVLRSADRA